MRLGGCGRLAPLAGAIAVSAILTLYGGTNDGLRTASGSNFVAAAKGRLRWPRRAAVPINFKGRLSVPEVSKGDHTQKDRNLMRAYSSSLPSTIPPVDINDESYFPAGQLAKYRYFPKPFSKLTANENLIIAVSRQIYPIPAKKSNFSLIDTSQSMRELMIAEIQSIGNVERNGTTADSETSEDGTNREDGTIQDGPARTIAGAVTEGAKPGDVVLYANPKGFRSEYIVKETNLPCALLEEKDILGRLPNMSCGPECLPELVPYKTKILVKPLLKRQAVLGKTGRWIRGSKSYLWAKVEKLGTVSGQERYVLEKGDKVAIPQQALLLLNPFDSEPVGIIDREAILGYDLVHESRPLGDNVIVEIQEPFRHLEDKYLGLRPRPQFLRGRIIAQGTGTHPLAPGDLPRYKFQYPINTEVLIDSYIGRQMVWGRYRSKISPPNSPRRFFVVREAHILGSYPESRYGKDYEMLLKELEPNVGYMLCQLKNLGAMTKGGLWKRLGIPAMSATEAKILKLGSKPQVPKARPPLQEWIGTWKQANNVTDAVSTPQSHPRISASDWIQNWKLQVVEGLSADVISARKWIEKWKTTRLPDLYYGMKPGDNIVAYIPKQPRLASELSQDDVPYVLFRPEHVIGRLS